MLRVCAVAFILLTSAIPNADAVETELRRILRSGGPEAHLEVRQLRKRLRDQSALARQEFVLLAYDALGDRSVREPVRRELLTAIAAYDAELNAVTRPEGAYRTIEAVIAETDAGQRLRSEAVRTLASIRPDEQTLELLLQLVRSDQESLVTRVAVLTLRQVGGAATVDDVAAVLAATNDQAVFGSAAQALGRYQSAEAVEALVIHRLRFADCSSVDDAITENAAVVREMLRSDVEREVRAGIEAVRSLWRPADRASALALLGELALKSTPDLARAACAMVIDIARSEPFDKERELLLRLRPAVDSRDELHECGKAIASRLKATLLPHTASDVPTPEGRPQ